MSSGYSNGVGRAFTIKKGSFLSGAALLAVQSKEAGIALVCTLRLRKKRSALGVTLRLLSLLWHILFQLLTYLVKILME